MGNKNLFFILLFFFVIKQKKANIDVLEPTPFNKGTNNFEVTPQGCQPNNPNDFTPASNQGYNSQPQLSPEPQLIISISGVSPPTENTPPPLNTPPNTPQFPQLQPNQQNYQLRRLPSYHHQQQQQPQPQQPPQQGNQVVCPPLQSGQQLQFVNNNQPWMWIYLYFPTTYPSSYYQTTHSSSSFSPMSTGFRRGIRSSSSRGNQNIFPRSRQLDTLDTLDTLDNLDNLFPKFVNAMDYEPEEPEEQSVFKTVYKAITDVVDDEILNLTQKVVIPPK